MEIWAPGCEGCGRHRREGGVLCVPGPTSPYPHRQGMEGWGGKLASIGSSKVTQVTLAGRAKNCCRQSTAGPMAGGQRGPEETARSPQPAHAPGPCGGPQCQARAEPVLTVSQELVLSHSEVLSLSGNSGVEREGMPKKKQKRQKTQTHLDKKGWG